MPGPSQNRLEAIDADGADFAQRAIDAGFVRSSSLKDEERQVLDED
jgi:hypothetical protein